MSVRQCLFLCLFHIKLSFLLLTNSVPDMYRAMIKYIANDEEKVERRKLLVFILCSQCAHANDKIHSD